MMSRSGMATFQLVLPSNSILKDLRTGTDGFASLKDTCSYSLAEKSEDIIIFNGGYKADYTVHASHSWNDYKKDRESYEKGRTL